MRIIPKNIIFLILFIGSSLLLAADVPYLTGRVMDNAEILSEATRRSLTAILKAHEDRTGNQIVVLTIPTIGGASIEEYALEVFNIWKLGQEDKDNGVLIVVVPNDRRMRIEVGYGLEAMLTDAMTGRIIRSVMTPKFKNGDYDAGIAEGTKAVVAVLEGGELAEVQNDSGVAEELSGFDMDMPDIGIKERILLGAFIFGIIGLFTIVGVLTPGAGWFLYIFLIPFWAVFPIIVVGTSGALTCLITYIIGFPVVKLFLKNKDWYKKAGKDLRTKGKASIGGFSFSSGGSAGSWSSGSSGFSGGGGSSGGGGASGSW